MKITIEVALEEIKALMEEAPCKGQDAEELADHLHKIFSKTLNMNF